MGVVFGAVGGIFLYFSFDFTTNAHATTGTVTAVSASYSDGSTTYKPSISFIDEAGVKQTGQTFLSSSSYNYPRGTKVAILYDTRTPHKLRIDSWFTLWGFPMIFLVVGGVLLVIMVIVARYGGKGTPRTDEARSRKPEASYRYSSSDPEPERAPTVRRG